MVQWFFRALLRRCYKRTFTTKNAVPVGSWTKPKTVLSNKLKQFSKENCTNKITSRTWVQPSTNLIDQHHRKQNSIKHWMGIRQKWIWKFYIWSYQGQILCLWLPRTTGLSQKLSNMCKGSVRFMLSIIASNNWDIQSNDIRLLSFKVANLKELCALTIHPSKQWQNVKITQTYVRSCRRSKRILPSTFRRTHKTPSTPLQIHNYQPISQLNWLSGMPCPDISIETCQLSSRIKTATQYQREEIVIVIIIFHSDLVYIYCSNTLVSHRSVKYIENNTVFMLLSYTVSEWREQNNN